MKIWLLLALAAGVAIVAPDALAQSVGNVSETEGIGAVKGNIETGGGILLDIAMFIAALVGVGAGLIAIGPIKECLDPQPGQQKPVGKMLGLLVVCMLGLGSTYWIYTVQYAFSGGDGKSGPGGEKVHERYKGG